MVCLAGRHRLALAGVVCGDVVADLAFAAVVCFVADLVFAEAAVVPAFVVVDLDLVVAVMIAALV